MTSDDRPTRWRSLARQAVVRHDQMVESALVEVASKTWGRGRFRRPWRIVKNPEEGSWRAYRYLSSSGDADHRYLEIGVVCHLDPDGNLVGFGVDNGVDFVGLHDTTDYGLRRGLDFIRQQRQQVRSYPEPIFAHRIKTL